MADVEFILPPEHAPGVYANFLVAWHSTYEFTLDFCVTRPMGVAMTTATAPDPLPSDWFRGRFPFPTDENDRPRHH